MQFLRRRLLGFLVALPAAAGAAAPMARADYFTGDRRLELRNGTSRRIWITKSRQRSYSRHDVQWDAVDPGRIWGNQVLQGSWLHYGYARRDDPGRVERIISTQLP